jgi:hypothetical protein
MSREVMKGVQKKLPKSDRDLLEEGRERKNGGKE